jgi:hypothetical protein
VSKKPRNATAAIVAAADMALSEGAAKPAPKKRASKKTPEQLDREAVSKAVDKAVTEGTVEAFTPKKAPRKKAEKSSDLSVYITPGMAARAGLTVDEAKAVLRKQQQQYTDPGYFEQVRRDEFISKHGGTIVMGPLYPQRRKPKNCRHNTDKKAIAQKVAEQRAARTA